MANRHLSRSIVLQSLFEWDFGGQKENIKEILNRNTGEFAPGLEDDSFMRSLLDSAVEKRKIIDEIIEKAAPDWPLDKISGIDRNILRIGLAELLFGDHQDVPPKVAINEAIELSKTFGGENSSKFINGVLGAVYKEMGEPGKDQTGKRGEVDLSKIPLEKLGGAVVYANDGHDFYLALVHDIFGYWTLSKGRLEGGESDEDGTIRELKEEIGLDITIKEKLGENEYVMSHPEKGKIKKHVSYFLAEAKYQDLKLESSGGLDDARWFKLNEVADLIMYDDIVPIITKAVEIISK